MDGLLEIASLAESDVVVTAVVGMIGIRPTIAAIESREGRLRLPIKRHW